MRIFAGMINKYVVVPIIIIAVNVVISNRHTDGSKRIVNIAPGTAAVSMIERLMNTFER